MKSAKLIEKKTWWVECPHCSQFLDFYEYPDKKEYCESCKKEFEVQE